MKLTNSSCVERLWLQITHTYTHCDFTSGRSIKVSVCLHVRTPYSFTVCYRVLCCCLCVFFLFFSHRFMYIHRIANFKQILCAFSTKFLDRSHLFLTLCSSIYPVQILYILCLSFMWLFPFHLFFLSRFLYWILLLFICFRSTFMQTNGQKIEHCLRI